MQTFLPFADFKKSAEVLDYRRLGKQRVEAMQLLNAIDGKSKGWVNHPATRMWKHHPKMLCVYMQAMIDEWMKRGYKNTMSVPYHKYEKDILCAPPWLGNEEFHASHRAALLHKNSEHYSQFGWKEKPELNYVWPI